ncbi:hypothetical protein [Aeromonas eucrenophila]|uniref:Uncharacterized protein n=1 Tax=Aeromonas eucrenophila TaxID=649 RepID=A0ABW0YE55_9GAMM|nr:hypothetical protein [Aeromonas eucrenophila]
MNKKLRALLVSHSQDPTVQMDSLNRLFHLAGPLFERTSNPQLRKCWISEHPSICFISCNGSPIRSFRKFIAAFISREARLLRLYEIAGKDRPFNPDSDAENQPCDESYGLDEEWHGSCLKLWVADFMAPIRKPTMSAKEELMLRRTALIVGRVNDCSTLEAVYHNKRISLSIEQGVNPNTPLFHLSYQGGLNNRPFLFSA